MSYSTGRAGTGPKAVLSAQTQPNPTPPLTRVICRAGPAKPTDNRVFFDETDVKLVVSFATETVPYQTGKWPKSTQTATLGLLSVEVSLSLQNYDIISEGKYVLTLNREYSAMIHEATEQSQGSEKDCNAGLETGISTLAKGSAGVKFKKYQDYHCV